MRVTTGMINAQAKKAGIITTGTSMLSYLDKDASQDMVNALTALSNSKKTSAASAAVINMYTDVKEDAQKLKNSISVFTDEKKSILAKAKENGDTSAVVSAVKDFVNNYNKVYKKMSDSSTALDQFYASSLKEAVNGSSTEFETLGVSFSKDGTISLDEEKLKKASVEDFEKVFGETTDFIKMSSFIVSRIESNAQANLDSVNSIYNLNGSSSSIESYGSNYDFLG